MAISSAEYRSMAKKPKRSKYGNTAVVVDGHRFDSKLEARYYQNLRLLEKARQVTGVEMQKPYALVGPDGALITTYRADFVFYDCEEKRMRVVDCKGVETKEFKIKRKLMKSLLGIDVEIVKA